MVTIRRNKTGNNSWYDYYLYDGKNELRIIFGANGDLYFCSKRFDKNQEAKFYITKENMLIYNLFDELYNNFKTAEIFHIDEFQLQSCNSKEEIKEKYEQAKQWNQELKQSSIYKKVFNNKTIPWISDDSVSFDIVSADALRITKEDNQYKLKFTYYENQFPHVRSIRIRNSGSRYDPFNIIMMKFFNKLQEYNPEYHQIHIEECLYNKNQEKQLIKIKKVCNRRK